MIRKADEKDIPQIMSLINENRKKLLARTEEEVMQLLKTFWVAQEGEKIVGCACLEVYSKKIAEIRSVAVSEPFRCKGYGTMLVKAAAEEARKLQIEQILVVTSTPSFFEQLGFGPCLNEKYALFLINKED